MFQSRALSVLSFALLFFQLQVPLAAAYDDISGSAHKSAIEYWTDQGVIQGYPDGTYKPFRNINRAEFLKIALGAAGTTLVAGNNCFPDVKNEWYAPFVCQAKAHGIVQGYDDHLFHPERNINYVEALKIIYLANNDPGSGNGTPWYYPYTHAAETTGVALSGVLYGQLMNRGQIAQLAYNYKFREISSAGTTNASDDTGSSTSTPPSSDNSTPSAPLAAMGDIGPRACSGIDPADGIYVSPSGNDSTATGSIDSPYKSINSALASAEPGDTVILRGGTYREGSDVRVRQPNITIKSRNGEWAVIDLSDNTEDVAVYFDAESSGGKLQCVEVIGGFYAFSTETKWDWGEEDRSGASNITIEDSKLHGSARDVVKIKPNSDNITIQYNEIFDSGIGLSTDDCNAEGIDNVNGDNMLVRNNYIHDTCSNAVYFKGGASDGIVENNRIENAGGAGVLIGFDTSPEFFDLNVNPEYYENIRGIVRNNLIMHTGLSGIGLYASKDAQVYNNTLIDVANGEYHSAIYFGVTFQDWEDFAGRPANINPSIHDNVISQPSSISRPMIEVRYSDELGGLSALDGMPKMSNNCYSIDTKTAQFTDNRPGQELDLASLSGWQAHIGGDTGSIEIDPILDEDYQATAIQCVGRGYKP